MTPITLTPSTGDGVTSVFTAASFVVNELLLQDRLPQIPTTDYSVATVGGVSVYTFVTAPVNGAVLTLFGISPGTALGSGTGTTTLAAVRAAAADRADMPTPTTTTFITTATWLTYINASYQELYDLLIQKYGDDYYSALDTAQNPYRLTTNGTADKYPLPDGSNTYRMPDTTTAPAFYKLLAVDVYLSGSDSSSAIRMQPFNFADRNAYNSPSLPAWGSRSVVRYRLIGNYIWFIPKPVSSQTMALWYAPRLTLLSADSDTLDGVSGWEEYIVVDAARKAAIKEESFELADRLLNDKAMLRQRIEEASENRDAGSPGTVADVRDDGAFGGNPWGY